LPSGAQAVRNQRPVVAASDAAAGMQEGGRVRITNGPIIEEADSNHARIAWSTNIQGSTRVTYGTQPGDLNKLAQAPWGVGGLTHRVELKNLQPATTYYFQVETGQAAGSEVESGIFGFRTPNTGEAAIRQQNPSMLRSGGQANGQQAGSGAVYDPKMREALYALQQARMNLQQAAQQFSGHRQKALDLVEQAIQEIHSGFQFAQQGITNPGGAANQQSYVQPLAASADNTSYPRMTNAQRDLEQARNALQQAAHHFGGHRQKALDDITQALQEISLGIQAAGQR
jgi:Purple acid Phosphatase, N-terminal domain